MHEPQCDYAIPSGMDCGALSHKRSDNRFAAGGLGQAGKKEEEWKQKYSRSHDRKVAAAVGA
jgi:hypothetical protein